MTNVKTNKRTSRTSQEDVDKIFKMSSAGMKSRAIAKELYGIESKKSTVNNVLKTRNPSWEIEVEGGDEWVTNDQSTDNTEGYIHIDGDVEVRVSVKPDSVVASKSISEEEQLEIDCGSGDKDIASLSKRLRKSQRTVTQLRKIIRQSHDAETFIEGAFDGLRQACEGVKKAPVKITAKKSKGRHLTAELLFSDLQIGKLMKNYNTDIAKRRVKEYAKVAITKIEQHIANGYVFDRIVLALLGDLLESDEKHHNSARACDSSTAEQMKDAADTIFLDLIDPLAALGIPIDCICITGNHDWNGHGLNMFKPGLNQLSYPLFHTLSLVSSSRGYNHIKFTIPEGCFHVDEIYGFKVLYEHGVGVSTAESAMSKRKNQRGEQLREHITYFRMGDKHNISRFNEDTHVINGAFFGGDDTGGEYSSICGYASDPAQLMIFHTPREDDRLSIYDSCIVQLKHIK